MTSNEHKQIVQKMCELFDNIDTKNLPELVQELLQLCKDEHIVILFLKLRYYFSKYLHSYQNNDADKIGKKNYTFNFSSSQLKLFFF